jgi:hypothetical protein
MRHLVIDHRGEGHALTSIVAVLALAERVHGEEALRCLLPAVGVATLVSALS